MSRSSTPKRLNPKQRKLVEDHAGLAGKIARKYCADRGLTHCLDEVEASAYMGLVCAAFSWSPLGGKPFRNYAWIRMHGQIIDDLRDYTRLRRAQSNGVAFHDASRVMHFGREIENPAFACEDASTVDDRDEIAHLLRKLTPSEKIVYRMCRGDETLMKHAGQAVGVGYSRVSQMLMNIQRRLEADHED